MISVPLSAPRSIPAAPIVNLVGVGNNAGPYGFQPELLDEGWAYKVRQLELAEALGCRSHMLFLPFGAMPGNTRFRAGSALCLAGDPDPRIRRLFATFAASIRPLVKRGNTVIAYCGMILGESLAGVAAAVRPVIDAGCDLAIDASSGIEREENQPGIEYRPEWAALAWLKDAQARAGFRLWIEARPAASATHFEGWGVCCHEAHWNLYGEAQGAMPRSRLGPVIRWADTRPRPKPGETDEPGYAARMRAELPAAVAKIQSEGCLASFDVTTMNLICPGLVTGEASALVGETI